MYIIMIIIRADMHVLIFPLCLMTESRLMVVSREAKEEVPRDKRT